MEPDSEKKPNEAQESTKKPPQDADKPAEKDKEPEKEPEKEPQDPLANFIYNKDGFKKIHVVFNALNGDQKEVVLNMMADRGYEVMENERNSYGFRDTWHLVFKRIVL